MSFEILKIDVNNIWICCQCWIVYYHCLRHIGQIHTTDLAHNLTMQPVKTHNIWLGEPITCTQVYYYRIVWWTAQITLKPMSIDYVDLQHLSFFTKVALSIIECATHQTALAWSLSPMHLNILQAITCLCTFDCFLFSSLVEFVKGNLRIRKSKFI